MKTETVTLPDGSEVQAVEVDFRALQEEWNEYEVADGTRVKVKTVVLKILRVVDEDGEPAYTEDGDPWVVVRNVRHITSREVTT